jgi:hypothetical protein
MVARRWVVTRIIYLAGLSGLAGILSVLLFATRPASAQPPGTTDPALQKLLQGKPDDAARTGPGAPPGTSSAPPRNAAPVQTAGAGSESPDRGGVFVLGSTGMASRGLVGDLQAGWTISPRLNVFASIGGIVDGDGVPSRILGLGARRWLDRAFLEARAAVASTPSAACDVPDSPCVDVTTYLGMAGAGVELIRRRHVGLELRGEVIFGPHDDAFFGRRDVVFLGTLGLGFYR